jgi:hypothetical protein
MPSARSWAAAHARPHHIGFTASNGRGDQLNRLAQPSGVEILIN